KRRVLGRFSDDRAARDECRPKLKTQQSHWIVEGRNRNHHANWLPGHDDLLARCACNWHLRMDAKALLSVYVHQVGRALDFGNCGSERTAQLSREDAAYVACAVPHQVCSFFLQSCT